MPISTLVLVKNKTINCAYVIFYLSWWKIQYPQKIPLLFSRPKKILASFIDRKNPFWPKCQTQKNPLDPPVIKICEWGPWAQFRRRSFHEPNLIRIKADPNYLDRLKRCAKRCPPPLNYLRGYKSFFVIFFSFICLFFRIVARLDLLFAARAVS